MLPYMPVMLPYMVMRRRDWVRRPVAAVVGVERDAFDAAVEAGTPARTVLDAGVLARARDALFAESRVAFDPVAARWMSENMEAALGGAGRLRLANPPLPSTRGAASGLRFFDDAVPASVADRLREPAYYEPVPAAVNPDEPIDLVPTEPRRRSGSVHRGEGFRRQRPNGGPSNHDTSTSLDIETETITVEEAAVRFPGMRFPAGMSRVSVQRPPRVRFDEGVARG